MARVIGVGCISDNASAKIVDAITHVEYRGTSKLQSRVDRVRAKKAPMQFDPWEIIHCEGNMLNPDLPSQFEDIVVKQHSALPDVN